MRPYHVANLLVLSILAHDGIPRASQASPTLYGISNMLAVYQETVRSILDQSDHPGISSEDLELFKSQFRASAYTCRLKSCPRATLGFETDKARLDHELAHVRKFRCTFPDCHFLPFVSAQALKGHTNKYHNPNPAPKSIRNIQTPLPPKRYLTRHDGEDDQSLQKRRKNSLLWLSTYSNITQPEENEQALNKRADQSPLRDPPIHLPLSGHQTVRRMKFWGQSGAAKIFSDEATEQTKTPPPATRHDSLVSPSLKRGFSPEPWLDPYETAMSEATQAQNCLPVGSVHPPSTHAVLSTPLISQMESRMDKWDHEHEKNGELKVMGDRRTYTDGVLLHHKIQGSKQKQADVESWHGEMYDFKQPARVTDAHIQSGRKASNDIGDEQVQMPSIFDVLLRNNDPQKMQTISSSSADGPSEQYRPSQHRGAVGINKPVIEISDDEIDEISDADSDETADDDWGRALNMDLYHIIINLMELPAHFPYDQLEIPPTFERWEDFWPWMRRHPKFSVRFGPLADIQYSQFKQKLLHEAGFSLDHDMKPAFGASNLESERVRNSTRWYGHSDYGIIKAVVNTKRAIWREIKNRTDGLLQVSRF